MTQPKDKMRRFLAIVALSPVSGITLPVYSGPNDFGTWYELGFNKAGGLARASVCLAQEPRRFFWVLHPGPLRLQRLEHS